MKVLNFGSLNYDYVYQLDHIVIGGETQTSTSMETHLGGKGFNQSVALAKAGAEIYHAGTIGEEGQMFLDACKKYGVNTQYIRQISGKSGHTIIQVDKNAQNCILLFGGSNRSQTKEYIDEVLGNFEKDDYLILQNEINQLDYIIDKAYEIGMQIVLNPSPYDDELKKCDFSKVSYFLLNEIEGEMMTGEKEAQKILAKIKEKYPKSKVVLTMGTAGAYYQDDDTQVFQDVFKVKAVDTTAAGDTFTGYFIAGIIEGRPMQEVMERCAKASSIAVSRQGAADSIPFKEEV